MHVGGSNLQIFWSYPYLYGLNLAIFFLLMFVSGFFFNLALILYA